MRQNSSLIIVPTHSSCPVPTQLERRSKNMVWAVLRNKSQQCYAIRVSPSCMEMEVPPSKFFIINWSSLENSTRNGVDKTSCGNSQLFEDIDIHAMESTVLILQNFSFFLCFRKGCFGCFLQEGLVMEGRGCFSLWVKDFWENWICIFLRFQGKFTFCAIQIKRGTIKLLNYKTVLENMAYWQNWSEVEKRKGCFKVSIG